MYAHAFLMSAGITAASTGLPYFHLGALDIGVPIQWFGMIVAVGVLIGATPLRRYAEWHGVSDDHIRGLLTWLMVSGFLGAHEFDVIAYQWDRIGETVMNTPRWGWFPAPLWPSNWPLVLRIWDGISSYGGFIGGATGYALYVWWKRLPARLFADITIVGLLPAFSIGRIACTVVSDHIGAAVDPDRWYSFLAMDYPRSAAIELVKDATTGKVTSHIINPTLAELFTTHDRLHPGTVVDHLLAWNLGLVEFLYLVPVNLLILWLAFRSTKRMPAGFVTALTGVCYAPVRFLLDFLRPEDTDPRYLGLTFAQWSSILAFGAAIYAAGRIRKTGAPAETVTPTSREAQERLRVILRDDDELQQKQQADRAAEAERKKAELARLRAERDREDAEAAAAEAAERGKAAMVGKHDAALAGKDPAEDAEAAEAAEADTASKTKPATPSGAPKPGTRSGGTKNKNRKR
jgi:phosphatidylglycerol---prolipoprotein diacylglyceryl transferase